ncbi:DUF5131 family protein [Treponema sp. R6D11]
MNKTPIEWCDRTWNPVTGCLHNCPYCYARKIVRRFGKKEGESVFDSTKIHDRKMRLDKNPYPYGFDPTFHRYRLEEPQLEKKPQNVFVCSMADLFGEWVPDEWTLEVFKACEKAPQHRYLFLTKNPIRYTRLFIPGDVSNMWFGTTITNDNEPYFCDSRVNSFLSIEPIQSDFTNFRTGGRLYAIGWVIIGAETGNRKDKIIPQREWIERIIEQCRFDHVPIFMKDSLAEIWGKPLIREYPWLQGESE